MNYLSQQTNEVENEMPRQQQQPRRSRGGQQEGRRVGDTRDRPLAAAANRVTWQDTVQYLDEGQDNYLAQDNEDLGGDVQQSNDDLDDNYESGESEDESEEEVEIVNNTPRVNNTPQSTQTQAHTTQAQPNQHQVRRDSALTEAAEQLIRDSPADLLKTELAWQRQVEGDPAKIKVFKSEVLQRTDLLAFAYMRPASSFIHVLHTAGTFSLPSGDEHYRGKEIAFVGDKTEFMTPTPVQLAPDQPWKWITKKIGMDIGPLELFFATPANAQKLCTLGVVQAGADYATLPRLLVLPPQFIEFCVTGQRTPFQFHNYLATAAVALGAPVTLKECELMLNWCIMASHYETQTHTSVLAFSLDAAISTDITFNKWAQRRLRNILGHEKQQAQPSPTVPAPPGGLPPVFTQVPPYGMPGQYGMLPPQAMWHQFAASLTQGLAAAMQPTATALAASAGGVASAYEEGGRNYDKYQLAVVRGFSHTHEFTGIQKIWALFQTTKHVETHRNNIKRTMAHWADAQRPPVLIDRNLYITNATLKDILALRFNPGNSTAELETAEQGLLILICRPRSSESKAAQRKRELIEGRASKSNLSLGDAKKMYKSSEPTACPEDYNALTKCLGTYCALVHTLFGSRCVFFKHCRDLLLVMNSDRVTERQHAFTPVFCRQVIWAIVEDGRAYFSQQMTAEDFVGVHPDDIEYPESTLDELKPHLRNQSPIFRSSFPPQWSHPTPEAATREGRQATGQFPVANVMVSPASVVSGLSAPTATQTQTVPRPTVTIRPTTHPKIKQVFATYIQKFGSVRLLQLLNSMNLTLADLPSLSSLASDTTLCYNFVLGRCAHSGCQHKHVPQEEIPDEFATALVNLLQPSVTNFMTNGAPPPTFRRKKRK